MSRTRKAASLLEMLLLIIVIILVMLLLSCCLGNCNGSNLDEQCAANLRAIGQAMYIYAQDDPQVFPAIADAREENDGLMRVFHPDDRIILPLPEGIPSPTVDMWTVVRTNNTTPSQFICPWTDDEPDPALFTGDYFDFLSAHHLSYAYQFQHDPDRRIIGTSSEPNFPLMADGNPYIKGGVQEDFYIDRLSDDQGNSTNHQLRQHGQNVLYQDGHVDLEPTPGVGLFGRVAPELGDFGFDNIYTVYEEPEPIFMDPGAASPTATWCNLGGRSDACLVQ